MQVASEAGSLSCTHDSLGWDGRTAGGSAPPYLMMCMNRSNEYQELAGVLSSTEAQDAGWNARIAEHVLQ